MTDPIPLSPALPPPPSASAEPGPSEAPWRMASVLLFLTAGFFVTSAFLVREHGRALQAALEEGWPLAAETSVLERREKVLSEQLQAVRLQDAVSGGGEEERFRLYVLPEQADVSRAVTALAGAIDLWRKEGNARSVSPLSVGDVQSADVPGASLVRRSLTFSLSLRREAREDFHRFFRIAGLLTVQDLLTPEERRELILLSEEGNPAHAAALHQYFSTDLLAYLRGPSAADEHLLTALPSDQLAAFLRRLERSPAFRDASALARGGLGHLLWEQKLWPLPFQEISSLREVEDPEPLGLARGELRRREDAGEGWTDVDVELWVYGR